jgi:hypothetical protein
MPARAQQGTAPGSAIVTTLALATLNGPWSPGWRAVAFARTYPEAWAKMQVLYARRWCI